MTKETNEQIIARLIWDRIKLDRINRIKLASMILNRIKTEAELKEYNDMCLSFDIPR